MKDNRTSSHYKRYFVLYVQYRGYSKLSWRWYHNAMDDQPIPNMTDGSTLKVWRGSYDITASHRTILSILQYLGHPKLSWSWCLNVQEDQPIPITLSWSILKVGRGLYGIVASHKTICGISTASGVLQTILELISRCPGGSTDTHFDIWVNSNGRWRVVWHHWRHGVTQDDM